MIDRVVIPKYLSSYGINNIKDFNFNKDKIKNEDVKIIAFTMKNDRNKKLFENDKKVTFVDGDISNFINAENISKVKDFSFMFLRCVSLTSINIQNFDSINAEKLTGMFHNCESLKELDMKKEAVVLALEAIVEPVSLYEPVYSEGGDAIYVMDQIGDGNLSDSWVDEILIRQAMEDLSDREKRILNLRFMVGKTQTEVAAEVGISQAQVSRLEKNAIAQIKRNILA